MLCISLYAEFLLFQNTGITEKGHVMATTKETMNVIANGVDKKEEPEIIMGGKVRQMGRASTLPLIVIGGFNHGTYKDSEY